MSSSLESFLRDCGLKPTSKRVEWLGECPLCGGQDKFYFNTQKLVGYCVKCSRPLNLEQFARKVSGENLLDVFKWIKEHQDQELRSKDFEEALLEMLHGPAVADTPWTDDLPECPLPPDFIPLREGLDSVIGRRALTYLRSRGFDLNVLASMGFGFCPSGPYRGRVIIPFYEHGTLVYWQARDFTGAADASSKILNPDSEEGSVGKSHVIFNHDGVLDAPVVVVSESWGSALAIGPCAVGLNGKSMSATQLEKLSRLPAELFIVLLDHGALDAAWKVAATLSAVRPTKVAFLPYGDPNEVPAKVLRRSLKAAVAYDSSEVLTSSLLGEAAYIRAALHRD